MSGPALCVVDEAQPDEAGDVEFSDAELGALLVLCTLRRVGPARLRAFLSHQSALEALADLADGPSEQTLAALADCRGVDSGLLAAWRTEAAREMTRAHQRCTHPGAEMLAAHREAGVWFARPGPSELEFLWSHDPEPPSVLLGCGKPIDPHVRRVGIVGTRRCSGYGRSVAQLLGRELAAEGVAVVSGLATGIDGIAQRAALDAGGPVIAVVGSGLDRVYPPANRTLWADVAREGTMLSEYPLGTAARTWSFPARNRILAAMCEVLVVVESGAKGGSMYTVDAAAERLRPVMAVPGPITSAASVGTNRLLTVGCAPVCDVTDVMVALGEAADGPPMRLELGRAVAQIERAATAQVVKQPDDPLDRRLLDELAARPLTADELAARSGAGLGALASSLARLQLDGWATETGGWWERLQ